MQNVQCLICSSGANKYIWKYIFRLVDYNYTDVSTAAHKNGALITQSTFLHNSKLSTSASNEAKVMEKDKKKNQPERRVISIIEMIQIMLLYVFNLYSNNASRI